MGIKFRCQSCDKKLHVKAFLAGKRGVCPYCGAKVRIPKESQEGQTSRPTSRQPADSAAKPPQQKSAPAATAKEAGRSSKDSAPTPATAAAPHAAGNPIAEAPDAVWYVRPPSGGQYGPADGAIMQRWLDEGRVGADSLVWREGWPDWKIATDVFASLRQPTAEGDGASSHGAAKQPVADPFSVVDKRSTAHRTLVRSSHRRRGPQCRHPDFFDRRLYRPAHRSLFRAPQLVHHLAGTATSPFCHRPRARSSRWTLGQSLPRQASA